jgi:hypothetical protein
MCAELDVVDVAVEDDDAYVILRMTWRQEKAYRDGRFTPRYRLGRSEDVMLDEDGNGVEIFDVTDQSF